MNSTDSLFFRISSTFSVDFFLVNAANEYPSAIKFREKPFAVWIQKDLNEEMKRAIAGLYAVIYSIKDY